MRSENKRKLEQCIADHAAESRPCASDVAVFRYNEKGEKVFYEAAERETAIAENQKAAARPELPAAADDVSAGQRPLASGIDLPGAAKSRPPASRLFLFQVGLIDLDVGLALQARQIGVEHLVADLVADATVEGLEPLGVRRPAASITCSTL